MSRYKILFLHCSATPEGKDYTKQQVLGWFKNRGWSRPGYNKIVHLDGTISRLWKVDEDEWVDSGEITNGVRGFNKKSKHFAYIGGVEDFTSWKPKDTRTTKQVETLEVLVKYEILHNPHILVAGHNQVSAKACPSFDVPTWLREIGVSEKNIAPNNREILQSLSVQNQFDFKLEDFSE